MAFAWELLVLFTTTSRSASEKDYGGTFRPIPKLSQLVLRTDLSHMRNTEDVRGARRPERHARRDDQSFALFGDALVARDADGALDHVGEIVRVLGLRRVDAPGEGHAPRRVDIGREA